MMGVKWSTSVLECQLAFKDFRFTVCTSYVRQPIVLRDSCYTILYATISGIKLNCHWLYMWVSWEHCLHVGVEFATWPVLWSGTCLWSTVPLISVPYQNFNFMCVLVCVHSCTLLSWFYNCSKSVILGTSYTDFFYLWILTICSWGSPWNI
jgi:hypothetical protein